MNLEDPKLKGVIATLQIIGGKWKRTHFVYIINRWNETVW